MFLYSRSCSPPLHWSKSSKLSPFMARMMSGENAMVSLGPRSVLWGWTRFSEEHFLRIVVSWIGENGSCNRVAGAQRSVLHSVLPHSSGSLERDSWLFTTERVLSCWVNLVPDSYGMQYALLYSFIDTHVKVAPRPVGLLWFIAT